ncbi:(p)ppGpp synthetase [Tersicoccus sp. MR15.9]|uniref:GTP pyrophosphokinase n=1 Tax=Tersicoccus mangrovi TaxID=3121635 RepID=UPI002FE61F2D
MTDRNDRTTPAAPAHSPAGATRQTRPRTAETSVVPTERDIARAVEDLYARRMPDWEQARKRAQGVLTRVARATTAGGDASRLDVSQSRIKDRLRAADKMRRVLRDEPELAPFVRSDPERVVPDVVGLKVLCKTPRDLADVVEALREYCASADSDVDLIQVRDYVSAPKESGYRAFHLLMRVPIDGTDGPDAVSVEVQVKTRLQDAWSELTHEDMYKPGGALKPDRFHTSVARAMAGLLSEVDMLADELATELDARTEGGEERREAVVIDGEAATHRGRRTVTVRTTGARFALAVDAEGRQGLIPAPRIKELLGSDARIDVDDHLDVGDELTVDVEENSKGLYYYPVELPARD